MRELVHLGECGELGFEHLEDVARIEDALPRVVDALVVAPRLLGELKGFMEQHHRGTGQHAGHRPTPVEPGELGARGDQIGPGQAGVGAHAIEVDLMKVFDLVAEVLDAERGCTADREDVDDAAAARELAGLFDGLPPRVAGTIEPVEEGPGGERETRREPQVKGAQHGAVRSGLHQRVNGRDDDAGGALAQTMQSPDSRREEFQADGALARERFKGGKKDGVERGELVGGLVGIINVSRDEEDGLAEGFGKGRCEEGGGGAGDAGRHNAARGAEGVDELAETRRARDERGEVGLNRGWARGRHLGRFGARAGPPGSLFSRGAGLVCGAWYRARAEASALDTGRTLDA